MRAWFKSTRGRQLTLNETCLAGLALKKKSGGTIIGGLAVVAFWRSPHRPLGSGPPRAGYSQRKKRKEKGEKDRFNIFATAGLRTQSALRTITHLHTWRQDGRHNRFPFQISLVTTHSVYNYHVLTYCYIECSSLLPSTVPFPVLYRGSSRMSTLFWDA